MQVSGLGWGRRLIPGRNEIEDGVGEYDHEGVEREDNVELIIVIIRLISQIAELFCKGSSGLF